VKVDFALKRKSGVGTVVAAATIPPREQAGHERLVDTVYCVPSTLPRHVCVRR
jgi:hypothetical protein